MSLGEAVLQSSLILDTREGRIEIIDEPTYSFGSADNLRKYDTEIRLDDAADFNSVHGVRIDGKWSAVFSASGGFTSVHQHSAIQVGGRLYLAVGRRVVCLDLVTGSNEWSRSVDLATCFGVYWDGSHEALISHGEVQISRLSLTGEEIWRVSGADIFTEGFRCLDNAIEAIDFNQSVYLFDYGTGKILANS